MSNSITELDIYLDHDGVERVGDLIIDESLREPAASFVQEIESLLNDPDTVAKLCETEPDQISIAQIVECANLPEDLNRFESELFVAEILKEVVGQHGEFVEVGITEDGHVVLFNTESTEIVSPLLLSFSLRWKQLQNVEQLEQEENRSLELLRNYVESLEPGQTILSRQFLKSFGESLLEDYRSKSISSEEFASALVDSLVIVFDKLNIDPGEEIPSIRQSLLSVLLRDTSYESGKLEEIDKFHVSDQIYFYVADILEVFLNDELRIDKRAVKTLKNEIDRYILTLLTKQKVGNTFQMRLDPKYKSKMHNLGLNFPIQIQTCN